MKVGWMKSSTEGIIEVEVAECQKCGWRGPKSKVETSVSENQVRISESFT